MAIVQLVQSDSMSSSHTRSLTHANANTTKTTESSPLQPIPLCCRSSNKNRLPQVTAVAATSTG